MTYPGTFAAVLEGFAAISAMLKDTERSQIPSAIPLRRNRRIACSLGSNVCHAQNCGADRNSQ
jgi:hypothetical protein